MPKMMNRRSFLAAAGLGAGAALLVMPAYGQALPLTARAIYDDPDQPVLGNPHGDVTIAEFFDYQCPFCKKDYPVVEKFVKEDGNIRLVMKDWPIFGPASVFASHLVLGASVLGQYQTALNALMVTKGGLYNSQVTMLLSEAGVDTARAFAAYTAHKARFDGLLARNAGQAKALKLQGTPTFAIGTDVHPGVMNVAELKQAVAKVRG